MFISTAGLPPNVPPLSICSCIVTICSASTAVELTLKLTTTLPCLKVEAEDKQSMNENFEKKGNHLYFSSRTSDLQVWVPGTRRVAFICFKGETSLI